MEAEAINLESKQNQRMEDQDLKEEIAQLREDVETLKRMLGVGESATTDPPEIVCKSMRIPGPDGDFVYIGQFQDNDAGLITVRCADGSRLQIQGLYSSSAVRMYATGTNKELFSIGGSSGSGKIKVMTTRSEASGEMRAMPVSGFVNTYGRDGDLSGRIPKDIPTVE